MSLYKQPTSSVWWCQFRVAGQLVRRSTGETDRVAAEREERRLRSQREQAAPVKRRGVGTIHDLGVEDVARAEAEGGTSSWVERVETFWDKIEFHFKPSTDPIKITATDVLAFVADRRSSGVKGQTIRRELQALLRGLKSAKAKGWISQLPDPWPELKDDPKDPKQRGKLHPAKVIIRVASELPERACDGFAFCLATGLRLHELQRVRASFVRPAPAKSKAAAVLVMPDETTKGRKRRPIGLSKASLGIVRRREKQFGDEIFPIYGYGQALRRTCKRLGISPTVTMRDLRHAYASRALKVSGGNLSAVAKALGHTETETTNLYLHAEEPDVLDLADSALIIPKRSHRKSRKQQKDHATGRFTSRIA